MNLFLDPLDIRNRMVSLLSNAESPMSIAQELYELSMQAMNPVIKNQIAGLSVTFFYQASKNMTIPEVLENEMMKDVLTMNLAHAFSSVLN